jgi:hypothetical protein
LWVNAIFTLATPPAWARFLLSKKETSPSTRKRGEHGE